MSKASINGSDCISIELQESCSGGWELNALLPPNDSLFEQLNTGSLLSLDLREGDNSVSLPPFVVNQVSCSPSGLQINGVDQASYRLDKELDPITAQEAEDDSDQPLESAYRTDMVTSTAAVLAEIGGRLNVSIGGVSRPCCGLGTLSGTGLSALNRVTEAFALDWRVNASGAVETFSVLGSGHYSLGDVLSVNESFDFEQYKTAMIFQKLVDMPAYTEVSVVNGKEVSTVNLEIKNFKAQLAANNSPFTKAFSYPDNVFIEPYTMAMVTLTAPHQVTRFNGYFAISGGPYLFAEYIGINDTQRDYRVEFYDEDKSPIGNVSLRNHNTVDTDEGSPFKYARVFYYDSGGTSTMQKIFPAVDNITATVRLYESDPGDLEEHRQPFNYVYTNGENPQALDENAVSETLWVSQAQLESLGPALLWANNRSCHTLELSVPSDFNCRAGKIFSYKGSSWKVESVSHSLSSSGGQTDIQAAFLS
ncbi:hypothetical protein IJT93_07740 [bacterium]|nr:hypothetical protein [bacterium]